MILATATNLKAKVEGSFDLWISRFHTFIAQEIYFYNLLNIECFLCVSIPILCLWIIFNDTHKIKRPTSIGPSNIVYTTIEFKNISKLFWWNCNRLEFIKPLSFDICYNIFVVPFLCFVRELSQSNKYLSSIIWKTLPRQIQNLGQVPVVEYKFIDSMFV